MRKVTFLLAMIGALAFLPLQATPAHAQNVVDSISGMLEDLLGGSDDDGSVSDAFEDLGDELGPQFEDIGDTFSDAFSKRAS
ncbi:MAG: hypothetical protein SVK44_08375 [Nitrospirota bacterium]|nr:hypothetical protein [Nitrospirota bacterium]